MRVPWRRGKVRWPTTDLELLSEIYARYHHEFAQFSPENRTRSAKIYVPVDIAEVARALDMEPDLVFGRLYYHYEPKYGFEQADGSKVPFFSRIAGDDRDVVHFPLLATVLADLREQRQRHQTSTVLSILALVVAVGSAVISILAS